MTWNDDSWAEVSRVVDVHEVVLSLFDVVAVVGERFKPCDICFVRAKKFCEFKTDTVENISRSKCENSSDRNSKNNQSEWSNCRKARREWRSKIWNAKTEFLANTKFLRVRCWPQAAAAVRPRIWLVSTWPRTSKLAEWDPWYSGYGRILMFWRLWV